MGLLPGQQPFRTLLLLEAACALEEEEATCALEEEEPAGPSRR